MEAANTRPIIAGNNNSFFVYEVNVVIAEIVDSVYNLLGDAFADDHNGLLFG